MRLTRLRTQAGFTMPMVLGVLLVATLLGTAALAAARGGTTASGESRDEKQAYAAAEAGVNWYLSRTIFDNAFWSKCTTTAGDAAPVNDPWVPASNTEADPRRWRDVPDPDGNSNAAYSIELLPANGKAKCDTADPNGSMIDTTSGTFRIRSTGRYNGNKRAIIATFRRSRFLDFLYLTNYETSDPFNYVNKTQQDAAAASCEQLRGVRPTGCSDIQFAPGDAINGPLHSNDSLLICGNAKFGRTANDTIQTSAASPGYVVPSGCTNSPNFVSALRTGAGTVNMPSKVKQLEENALSGYKLTGTNYIDFSGLNMTIKTMTSATASVTRSNVPLPTNGLIYVDDGASGCTSAPPSAITYSGASAESYGCANVYVRGTFSKDVTIASAKDVIVNGSFREDSSSSVNAVAGLIADRFVRVFHPVTSIADSNGNCSGSNVTGTNGSLQDPVIEAAILARDHSFTVDNYRCGAALGSLTVMGGIAQKFRGAVGTGGNGSSSVSTGYLKDYSYDDRLTYRNPPFFLDPENATWRVLRSNEQVPAR